MSDHTWQQQEQEQQEMIAAVLDKVAKTLTEDEMSLLRWATGVDERKANEVV